MFWMGDEGCYGDLAGSILAVDNAETADLYHEQRPEEMELEVYAGKDGAFTCYMDSGNGYGNKA